MPGEATRKNADNEVSRGKKLGDLYELIEGIETCMMTTRRYDGRLAHWLAFAVHAVVLVVAALYVTFVRFDRLF